MTTITIRPFRPEDFDDLLDLANRAVPFAPRENAEWLAYRQAFDDTQRLRRHYIAVDDGQSVGYGCLEQQSEDPHSLRIFVVCDEENLRGEVGEQLYARLMQEARALAAVSLWARELQADQPLRNFFLGRGFVETDRFTLPDYPPMVVFRLEMTRTTLD